MPRTQKVVNFDDL